MYIKKVWSQSHVEVSSVFHSPYFLAVTSIVCLFSNTDISWPNLQPPHLDNKQLMLNTLIVVMDNNNNPEVMSQRERKMQQEQQ